MNDFVNIGIKVFCGILSIPSILLPNTLSKATSIPIFSKLTTLPYFFICSSADNAVQYAGAKALPATGMNPKATPTKVCGAEFCNWYRNFSNTVLFGSSAFCL